MFATREWLTTWQRHEEHGVALLASRRPDGSLAGLLPVTLERRLPRLLRPATPWPSPALSVVCAEEDRQAVTADLLRQLRRRGDLLRLQVPAGRPVRGAGTAVPVEPPVSNRTIPLTGTSWDELLTGSGRNSRRAHLRRSRRLEDRYAVGYRRTAEAGDLERDVETFLRLHWSRWGDEVFLLTAARAPFLHDFAAQALERGWLSLTFLELDGVAVAAQLSFRYAGAETAFMSALDPEFREEQVGISLLFHTIEVAIDEGMARFHLGPGDEPYKDRLPNVDQPVERVLVPVGPLGTAALTGWRALRAARSGKARRMR